eukprot:gnl/MRDRNA2_/MRDRNA2_29618_c0_seq1.p1 gnl/MRDRNA2_/MRDRNA2_29618_c0~~gnl/MRDRNA2_/MRDRNA2_29618_c0_seq1.p1  ORF type:complete len:409 (+),score=94.19 gnl/MRDRNA2_/MRDRNA2_29618_c0_seq1:101-1228(+)
MDEPESEDVVPAPSEAEMQSMEIEHFDAETEKIQTRTHGCDLPELYDMDEDFEVDEGGWLASWEYPLTQKEKLNRVLLLWERENRSLNEELSGRSAVSPRRGRCGNSSPCRSPRRGASKKTAMEISTERHEIDTVHADIRRNDFRRFLPALGFIFCMLSFVINCVLYSRLSSVRHQEYLLGQQHNEVRNWLHANSTQIARLEDAYELLEKRHHNCMQELKLQEEKDAKCDRVLELSRKLEQELSEKENTLKDKKKEIAQLLDVTQIMRDQAAADSKELSQKASGAQKMVEVVDMLARQVEEEEAGRLRSEQKNEEFASLYEYAQGLEARNSELMHMITEMEKLINWKNMVLKHASKRSNPLWIGELPRSCSLPSV